MRINLLSLQLQLEQALPPGQEQCSATSPSRRLRSLLDAASIEARSLRHDYIGTEHILLACVREPQSASFLFFEKESISIDEIRSTVQELTATRDTSLITRQKRPSPGEASQPQRNASLLNEYSQDLTRMSREGRLDPVIGRENEIKRVVQILSRRNKNNPVLIGEPGVGKTAIVEGLAERIVSEKVPRNLIGKKLLVLDLASVIAGTKYRGEFEERLKRIMKEIAEDGTIILFIDELHTIIGAGGAEGAMDASNMLKPALARGDLQCIGATTLAEYRQDCEKDAALERRFQTVKVQEPSADDTLQILAGIKNRYERHHHVRYTDDTLETIVSLSGRYLTDRFFPDKAIDILDETGAMKKIEGDIRPSELEELEERIAALGREKRELVQNQDYERAALVRDEVRKLRDELEKVRVKWQHPDSLDIQNVTPEDVCSVISVITGIPASSLNEAESARLVHLEDELHRPLWDRIRRYRSFRAPSGDHALEFPPQNGRSAHSYSSVRPVSEKPCSQKPWRILFGKEELLVRIDMSDYMENTMPRGL